MPLKCPGMLWVLPAQFYRATSGHRGSRWGPDWRRGAWVEYLLLQPEMGDRDSEKGTDGVGSELLHWSLAFKLLATAARQCKCCNKVYNTLRG